MACLLRKNTGNEQIHHKRKAMMTTNGHTTGVGLLKLFGAHCHYNLLQVLEMDL